MVRLLFLLLVAGFACDSESISDAGSDAGEPAQDAAPSGMDAQPRFDSGPSERPDAGFSDPNTLFEGVEEIGGVPLYVHLRGTLTSTMPPVLFLNTGPNIGHEYLIGAMDFLLPGRLLVLFDLRATGRSGFGTLSSTTSNAVTFDSHVEDVENVVEYLGGLTDASRVDFMGHGYGAAVAAHYAQRHPDRVSRLVLTAPFPATILQHALFHAELSARMSTADRERVLQITREPDCRGDVQQCSLELWNIEGPHYLCEENRDLFFSMMFRFADFRVGFLYIDRDLRNASYDWSADLARVSSPTTVISGPCDPIPADAALLYAAQIPGARHFILPNTGHFPMVEDSPSYQSIVRRALIYP